jgi:AhpD family alkylhydroperoxidase
MGEACLIRRLQQAGPQCSVHLEHGVHYLLGNLLDLFFRLIHLLFSSRSLRLRGKKWNPLDMFRARAIVLVRIVRPQTTLPDGVPGIRGLMAACPATQVHLSGLAEVLLRAPSSLTPGERETIAAYVSRGYECRYCCETHAAAARVHLGEQRGIVDQGRAGCHRPYRILGFRFGIRTVQKGLHISESVCSLCVVAAY